MSDSKFIKELGCAYEGDLVCVGVIEHPAIILENTKTGEKQVLGIGSYAYMGLKPSDGGAR
ncbi:MAG: hypothetical protein MEQ74_04980 [Paracoccus sp.]|nr:hypothetical protein [Paracoccus sp. (in: a-proteobacteria)]